MSKLVLENEKNLPIGWECAKISDLVLNPKQDIVDGPFGSNLKAIEYVTKGIPLIRLQNVDRNSFVNKNIKFITNEKYKQLQRHNFKNQDIVITKLGIPLGKACLVPDYFLNGIIVADIVRIRLHHKLISKKFLMYSINSPRIIKQFDNCIKGTTRPRVNLTQIRNFDINIPPLNEQKRIVKKIEDIFTKFDSLKNTLDKIKLELKQYRQSYLKSIFSEKHAENVEIKRLGDPDVSKIIMGQSPPGTTYNTEEKGMPFFQGNKDFGKKFPTVTVWCTEPKRIAKKGDILLSVRAPVGDVNWAETECCIGRGLSAIRVKIEPEYVYCFLKSIEIKLSGTGVGSVFNAISKNELYQIPLPVPSSSKQKEITSQIEHDFSIIQNAETIINSMLSQLDSLRSSLLKQAFEGKLVEQDPSDESAEILLQKIKLEKEQLKQKEKAKKRKKNAK